MVPPPVCMLVLHTHHQASSTLVMIVSSMMPPFSLVYELRVPVPSFRPAKSPTARLSRKGIESLPYNACVVRVRVLLYLAGRRDHRMKQKRSNLQGEAAHVRHVEQGRSFAAVQRGVDDGILVLNGHAPSCERHHLPCTLQPPGLDQNPGPENPARLTHRRQRSPPPWATWKSYSAVFFRLASSANARLKAAVRPNPNCCSKGTTATLARDSADTAALRMVAECVSGGQACR